MDELVAAGPGDDCAEACPMSTCQWVLTNNSPVRQFDNQRCGSALERTGVDPQSAKTSHGLDKARTSMDQRVFTRLGVPPMESRMWSRGDTLSATTLGGIRAKMGS